jgi:hypothetical protein
MSIMLIDCIIDTNLDLVHYWSVVCLLDNTTDYGMYNGSGLMYVSFLPMITYDEQVFIHQLWISLRSALVPVRVLMRDRLHH